MSLDVNELKELYSKYQKKFSLPSFKELNEDFEIEKIDRESDCFLRVVRKAMMEKIVNALSFVELLLNPMNAPRIYIPFINSMTAEDKKEIETLYGVFSDLSLMSLELETGYDEKKEAELISNAFSKWNSSKKMLEGIIRKLRNPAPSVRKEKNYFG